MCRAGVTLTARDLRLIRAVMVGGTNRDVARRLGLKEQTVKNRLSEIYDKLGIRNRLELAVYVGRHPSVRDQMV